ECVLSLGLLRVTAFFLVTSSEFRSYNPDAGDSGRNVPALVARFLRRGGHIMHVLKWTTGLVGLTVAFGLGWLCAPQVQLRAGEDGPPAAVKGWTRGKGWGWVWGKEDEVGSLNAMTAETVKQALQLA